MFKKTLRIISKPVSSKFFFFVLILNLLSNYVALRWDTTLFAYVGIFLLSALTAYIESVIYLILNKQWLKIVYAIIVALIHNILIVCEYFLLTQFQMILNQDVIDILAETNTIETENFLQTYVSPQLVVSVLLLISVLNIITFFAAKSLSCLNLKNVFLIVVLGGIGMLVIAGYNFYKYRNGMSIPQYTTLTRSGYALYILNNRIQQIALLQVVCKNVKAKQNIGKKPTIVVVIGESFSVYHSSLYGYDKNTNPLLSKYKEDGSLFLFDNVVTLFDGTHGSMKADFSLDSLGVDYANQPLFPACFKAVGYPTHMYDNQYFVGSGVTFLTDPELSESMFDYRNTERYLYDGMMIDKINVLDSAALYVIHLWGQHYTYAQRYPEEFSKFSAGEYDKKYPEEFRQMMSNYDNATLYNDYVLDKIMRKFRDKYCCLFYFSDHGEEVYELRNYMGHGNAAHSPNLNYQIRVPLMVWFSPSFTAENEELSTRMKDAAHYPICTDDIGHTILDVAGITTETFAPTRSFINRKFNKKRHRFVLNSIDYDKDWINRK